MVQKSEYPQYLVPVALLSFRQVSTSLSFFQGASQAANQNFGEHERERCARLLLFAGRSVRSVFLRYKVYCFRLLNMWLTFNV